MVMDGCSWDKNARLVRRLEKLHELLLKFKTTVEGLFIHGSCSFWSVYGGLEKAQDDLWEILCFGLKRDRCEADLQKELSSLLQSSAHNEDGNDTLSLQDWINNHLLNFSMSNALDSGLIGKQNDPVVANLYEEYAAARNPEIVLQLVIILKAVEQNSLSQLGNLSPWLLERRLFLEKMLPYLGLQEGFMDLEIPENDTPNSPRKSQNGSPAAISDSQVFVSSTSTPESNSGSDSREGSQASTSSTLREESLQVLKGNNASKNPNSLTSSQLARNVLMKSALAAVMESNEDDVIWYNDSDRFSLTAEPVNVVRSRLVHSKEISRSETSLLNEKVLQTPHSLEIDNTAAGDLHAMASSDSERSAAYEVHSDLETQPKVLKRPSISKKGHSRSKSDQIRPPKSNGITEVDGIVASPVMSQSLPLEMLTTPPNSGEQGYYYQPEDGYIFPKPYEGQSLISYLNSRSYDTGAELDKENAHFSICEALITAIEQMKCSTILDSDGDTSDEEIETLRKKIQERKLRKKLEKLDIKSQSSDKSRSDTNKSSSSTLTGSSRSSSQASSLPGSVANDEASMGKLSHSWENLTLSIGRKLDPASNKTRSVESSEVPKPEDCSAEAIAKSLLKKFRTHKLPAASELKWVVSEEEVPQSLLPFPTSFPVSPDDANRDEESPTQKDQATPMSTRSNVPRFRGGLEWAPPRAQIVLVLHPVLKRKVILQKQLYRCAGCGLKVSLNLSKRFRYCEYFGKYFCTSCHSNQTSVIPARIILKWDFKRCPVSDFAFELLKKIYFQPLFDVSAINPNLYRSIKVMGSLKDMRTKVNYINNFLQTCRYTASLCRDVSTLPSHFLEDDHRYSIDDLVQIKRGELTSSLKALVSSAVRHIRDCQLCKLKGFVCEFCKDGNDILYPFEINRVIVCTDCKSCFHRACFVQEKCPKCVRLKAREMMRYAVTPDPISVS